MNSSGKDRIKIKVDRGRRNEAKRTLEDYAGGHQKQGSRQDQGFKRFWAPEIHSDRILSENTVCDGSLNYLRSSTSTSVTVQIPEKVGLRRQRS